MSLIQDTENKDTFIDDKDVLFILTIKFSFCRIRAAIRTLNPREEKFMEPDLKFKRQVFMNNVMRIKAVIMYFVDLANYVESCFEWESPMRSIIAFVAYVVTCYYCQPFWFPIFLLLIFARNYLVISYLGKIDVLAFFILF